MAASNVIAVVGGKGGVGKSTFAVNYAIATAIDSKAKVLLIDLDPKACGDLSMLLGIKPKRTLLELGKHEGRLDANGIMSYVAQHPTGIHFLQSVPDPDQFAALDADTVHKALQHAMGFYHVIIVDLGSDLDATAVKTFENSTMIYVVTNPEILVLSHTKRVIERIQNLLFPPEMIKLVLNRFSPKKGVMPQVVQTNLKKQILGIIPEDEATTVASLASAKPFIIAAPNTELTRAYFV